MSLYLTSLGDFSKSDYYENAQKNFVLNWIFFVLMTFIVFIIFMNLLISIMGNTLNDVLLYENEAKIMEQTHMIIDFSTLLDLTQKYKGKKYIICVSKDQQE